MQRIDKTDLRRAGVILLFKNAAISAAANAIRYTVIDVYVYQKIGYE